MAEKPLTARQRAFVREYLKDHNATQAAARAKFSRRTARQAGARMLSNLSVCAALSEAEAKVTSAAIMSAKETLEEATKLARTNLKTFLNGETLKPASEWTDEQGAQVASLEVVKGNLDAADGKTDRVVRLKFWSKDKALEFLGRHHQLLTDVVKVTTDDDRIARLFAGRKRASTR